MHNLYECVVKCERQLPNIMWCLEAILSLLKQGIYQPADLNYRMFQGTKYRRSLIYVLLFKRDLHHHLLNVFAPELKIHGEHLALLLSDLRDFKTFDALEIGAQDKEPSATLPAQFRTMPSHAQRLVAYIVNVIFRDHEDKKIFQQLAGNKRLIKEWVDSSPDLQMIAAEAKNAGLAGSVPGASASSCPAPGMTLPSICSIAFPQLDDEGSNEDKSEVYDIVKRSVEEVNSVMARCIRVLDSKVDDATSGCPESQMLFCS